MKRAEQTKRLTTSAVMLALAMVLAMVCALIPFLNLPFGGGFITIHRPQQSTKAMTVQYSLAFLDRIMQSKTPSRAKATIFR